MPFTMDTFFNWKVLNCAEILFMAQLKFQQNRYNSTTSPANIHFKYYIKSIVKI